MSDLTPLQESYTEDEATLAAQDYIRLSPYMHRLEHAIKTYARVNGGWSYGYQMVNGKPSGGISCFNTATITEEVIDPQLATDAIFTLPEETQRAIMYDLLYHERADHYKIWLGKLPDYAIIASYADQHDPLGQGGLRRHEGKPLLDIRRRPPDETRVKIVPMDETSIDDETPQEV